MAIQYENPSFHELQECLFDLSQPMGKRTRAVFYLRTRGQKEDLDILLQALQNRKDCELMRHELAYVIGQFQDASACDVLSSILSDETDDCIVRHEAAEALGAIGNSSSLNVLNKYINDDAIEVSQTCYLAKKLIEWKIKKSEGFIQEPEQDSNPYLSEDPTPADEKEKTNEELKETLLDQEKSMFLRYRAMFSLRNRNTEDAALALCEGFNDPSALFRHEIAYVMGQMENPITVNALVKVLNDTKEHKMVRHEAAEALGAIGTKECEEILKIYAQDPEQIVRESCEVALDAMDYWTSIQTNE